MSMNLSISMFLWHMIINILAPLSDQARLPSAQYWLVTRTRAACQLINQFYWTSKNDLRPNEISSIQSQFRRQVNVSVQNECRPGMRSSAKFRNVCRQLFVRSLNISPHVQHYQGSSGDQQSGAVFPQCYADCPPPPWTLVTWPQCLI